MNRALATLTIIILCATTLKAQVSFSIDTFYQHKYYRYDNVATITIYNNTTDTMYIRKKSIEKIFCLTDTNTNKRYKADIDASYILLSNFDQLRENPDPSLVEELPPDDTLVEAKKYEQRILEANNKLKTIKEGYEQYFLAVPFTPMQVNSIVTFDLPYYDKVAVSPAQRKRANMEFVLHFKYFTNNDKIIRDQFTIGPSTTNMKEIFFDKMEGK